jgi:hypothetical protein
MEFKVTIHYVIPCKGGGLQSKCKVHYIAADDEDEAEKTAIRRGVDDPNYLYTSMSEVELNFSPNNI